MRFAICNETFGDWPFEKAFALARECGYTGVEIAPFTIDTDARRISDGKRAEVRRKVEEAGLQTVALHWLLAKTEGFYLTTPDDTVRRATGEYLAELARLCRDLGGGILVLGSPQQRNLLEGVSHAEAVRLAADCIRTALPALEQCDINLAVEPLNEANGDFLNRAEQAVELIRLVDSPRCRLHLDVNAMHSEPTATPQIIRDNASLLEHFHANDPNLLGPGMGDVEFDPILQALLDIDYQGWVSVEVFDYSPGPERIARDSIRYLQECLTGLTS